MAAGPLKPDFGGLIIRTSALPLQKRNGGAFFTVKGEKGKMSIERVKAYFGEKGMEKRVWEFDASSATVELAAQTLGVRPARIAKTLSFAMDGGCILIVTAGDARIDNKKFKERFHTKAKMLAFDEVERLTGSAVGGVCPFALPRETPVYLDESLRRFQTVFPACGSGNSAIELSCDELYRCSGAAGWVDVCKDWDPAADAAIDDVPKSDFPLPGGGEVRLEIAAITQADEKTGYVPMYQFDIVRIGDGAHAGRIDLRLGYVRNTYYGGNVGYRVGEEFRGNGYAGKATRLVFEVARAHRMPYLIITCDKDNLPSRRTLERLGGELLECVAPPAYSGVYQEGSTGEHCIFRFMLD